MLYYFLISSFPSLQIGAEPQMRFDELKNLLELQLSENDQKKVRDFLLYIDIKNIRALWLEQPIDPRGALSEKELEEALLVQDGLPSYVFDFLGTYENTRDRLHFFTSIYAHFFAEKREGFLQKYFRFERELRLVLLALRSKMFHKDLAKELQFEDMTDSFVAYILAQKDAQSFEPPMEYAEVKTLFHNHIDKPLELAKKMLEYRFYKIGEMEQNHTFQIDEVLGFMAKLLLVEYWFDLDDDKGAKLIDSIA